MSELVRIIEFTPAYDKRDPNPKINFGIHGVEMKCVVRGAKGAVQFVLFTDWQLPHVSEEMKQKYGRREGCHPMAADIGYHSPSPRYEGQTSIATDCPYVDGGVCFYDGSTLNAERVFRVLVSEGGEAMWEYLESYYKSVFQISDAAA